MPARGSLRDARIIALFIAIIVIALDRWSKLWIVHNIPMGHARVIIPGVFRLTHVLNTGAAFSLFEGSTSPAMVRNLLVAFSVFAVIVVLALIWKFGRQFSLVSFSLALILGARPRQPLRSRAFLSALSTSSRSGSFTTTGPTYNVADSAICIGACLLLIEMLRPSTAQRDN